MKHIFKLVVVFTCFFVFGIVASSAQTPAEAAPTPPMRSDLKVMSIFSDAYTNIVETNFNPYWQQATIMSNVQIAGNATIKLANLNYQGFEFFSDINALPMTHFHIDVWTADETKMAIAPVSRSVTNLNVGLTPLVLNSWNSYDIELSSISSKWLSVSDIFQFFIEGAGGHTVFIDNLYFYNNMEGDDVDAPAGFTAVSGLVGFNSIEVVLNATDNSGAVFYELQFGETLVNLSSASGKAISYTFKNLNASTEFVFTAKAKDYSGNVAENNPISISVTTGEMPPSAPTPPARPDPKVISIFSDAYASIGGTNFFPYWQQTTQAQIISFNGDPVLQYDKFNYMGMELGSDINALPMTHLHIDVYTINETHMELSPISRSKTNTNVVLTPLLLNTWNSFDIKLSDVASKWVSVSDIYQFILKGSGTKEVYIDNLYFYNDSDIADTESPKNFTAKAGVVMFNSIELLLNATDNLGAVEYEINYGTEKLQVSGITGVEKRVTIESLNDSTAYKFTVTVKDPTGNSAAGDPIVIEDTTLKAVSAPVPTVEASKVISIFSNAYSNIEGTNFNPYWSQQTVFSSAFISDDEYIIYSKLNYQGIELGSHVNASTMKYLHVDVWTPDETALQVALISPGKEKLVSLKPLKFNTWIGFDIPLTSFTGVNLSDVFQFKFVGAGGKTIFIDNLYFHNSDLTAVAEKGKMETMQLFPNPVSSMLTINGETEIREVLLWNLAGQIISRTEVGAFTADMDFSKLSSGSYIISIKMVDGTVKNQKVVKLSN